LFEDAGKHLFNGEVDPRIVASYYPDLRGNLFNPEDSMDVFAGVAERMPKERSIDDISTSPFHAPTPLPQHNFALSKTLCYATCLLFMFHLYQWN